MAGLLLVSSFDVARALGDDPSKARASDVRDFLIEDYLRKRGGGFNHDPSITATKGMFEGSMSANLAIDYCRTSGNPAGRKQNAEIATVVAPYACANVSRCYKHDYLAVAVGRFKGKTIHVGLKAPFTRVQGSSAYVVLPGFRKSFVPTDAQINLPLSLAAVQLARDDFKGADIEYLHAGPAPGTSVRMLRVIHGCRRKLLDADELDDVFAVYVEGVISALDAGYGMSEPDLAGYRVIDPNAPTFFGP